MSNFLQTWTCENGGRIVIQIPENSTRDDLLAMKEFIDVVIEHRFKFMKEEKRDETDKRPDEGQQNTDHATRS